MKKIFTMIKLLLIAVMMLVMSPTLISTVSAQNYEEEIVVAGIGTIIDVGESGKIQLNGGSGRWSVDNPSVVSIDNYGFRSGVGSFGSYAGAFVEFSGLKAGSTTLKLTGTSGVVLFSEKITVNHVPVITTETETEKNTYIDYDTEYIEDANLKKGKEEVRVEGQKGYSVTTYTYTYEDDVLINTETDTVVIDLITEVIAKGTYEPTVTTETETEKHTYIDFDTEYIEDANLEKGTEEIRVEGQKGYSITTYTYIYEDGVLVNTEEDTVVIDPIAEVIAKETYEPTESQFGWVLKDTGWYYYSDEGTAETGWNKIKGTWYYMNNSGTMQTGWTKIGNIWYYMTGSGAMQTGWQQIGGSWYYLDSSGAMNSKSGWNKIGNNWYYQTSSGAMDTGWRKVGSNWYYMKDNAIMQTGWTRVGSTWYYLSGSGAMQTGWTKVGSTWYYLTGSGAMQTGWAKVGNTWYYMSGSGAMQTGWLKLGRNWYFLNSNGSMQVQNTTINGTWYRFDSSGRML